jgi:hypothetical protein
METATGERWCLSVSGRTLRNSRLQSNDLLVGREVINFAAAKLQSATLKAGLFGA